MKKVILEDSQAGLNLPWGLAGPLDSTAGCGKPHVRWCGMVNGRNPVGPIRSGLAKAVEGLAVTPSQTTVSPAGFTVDRECELKAPDESKAVVRYSRHALDIEEVQQHIGTGKVPTRLAMTWEGRVSFVLTEALQIKM